MSRPTNPLAAYNSYSYYHSLIMCNNSTTADNMVSVVAPEAWQQPNSLSEAPRFGMLGKFAPKELPGDAGGGQYVVLIDGTRSADLIIDKASWFATTMAQAVPGDQSSSFATEGRLEIVEPKGVAFMDIIVLAALSLGIDMGSSTFVLKTFFVGHGTNDDGTVFTDIISNVEPYQFRLTDITGEFTEAGGRYKCEVVGVANGTSRLPQYSRVGAGLKLALTNSDVTEGVTVRAALLALEQKVQTLYDQQFDCLINSIDHASETSGISNSPSDRLTKMHYHITIDPMYDASYVVTDSPSSYKTQGVCEDGIHIDSGPNSSIESMIIAILDKCPKIKEDAAFGISGNSRFPEGTKLQYRIKTSVRTDPVDGGTLRYDIHFHVLPYVVAQSDSVKSALYNNDDNTTTGDTNNFAAVKANTIEFDYLFTGNNVDVLNFDIKMNAGFSYLQVATQCNSFADQLEIVSSRSVHTPALIDEVARFGQPTQIPIPFSTQLESKHLINTEEPTSSTQAAYTMNKASAIDVSQSSIRVAGNLHLMNAVNETSRSSLNVGNALPEHFTDEQNNSSTEDNSTIDTRTDGSGQLLTSWGEYPAFCKINVKMPTTNDDETNYSAGNYARPFWYDGYFHIIAIENVFEFGQFYQNLELVFVPNDAIATESTTSAEFRQVNEFKTKLNERIQSCYDGIGGIPADNNAGSIAQPSKRENEFTDESGNATGDTNPDVAIAQPTNDADRGTLVASTTTGDPSSVTGWDKAAQNVKDAITQAANEYGTDLALMATFAFRESSFNPNAHNKHGAAGLYQHIPSTWTWMYQQGMIKGIANRMNEDEALQLRFNPLLSARGGASYMNYVSKFIGSKLPGDIYLGYFAGPGAARSILRNLSNNPNITLLQSVGKHAYAMQRANKSIIPSVNMKAADLRNWAHREITKNMGSGAGVPPSGMRPNVSSSQYTSDVAAGGSNNPESTYTGAGYEPHTQAGFTRTAADALSRATDPEIVIAQQNKTICGTDKVVPTSGSEEVADSGTSDVNAT